MSKQIEKIAVESVSDKQDNMVGLLNDLMGMDRELSAVLSILKKVSESGILEGVAAMLERNGEVMSVLFNELTQKENSNFVRNILTIYTLLSRVEPERLGLFMKNLSRSLNSADSLKNEKPLGLLGIGREIKDPDVSAGIRVLLSAAKGFTAKHDTE